MKWLLLILCAGCAVNKPPMPPTPVSVPMRPGVEIQSQSVIQPLVPIKWVWNAGDYTNFVVVSSTNLLIPLSRWPIFLITGTNFFQSYPTNAMRFFTLYGTNWDGQSAWVTK